MVTQMLLSPQERAKTFKMDFFNILSAEKYYCKMMRCDLSLKVLAVVITVVVSEASVLFSCSFKKGTCGMENQPGLRAYWHRRYLQRGGQGVYAIEVTGNEANNYIARFMTPYFNTRGAVKGCLSFDYFIDGRTPASLACIKQGYVTQYLFATARKTRDHWENARVDMEFLGDEVMLYFEADTRVQEYGTSTVAFTNVQVTNQTCNDNRIYRTIFRSWY